MKSNHKCQYDLPTTWSRRACSFGLGGWTDFTRNCKLKLISLEWSCSAGYWKFDSSFEL